MSDLSHGHSEKHFSGSEIVRDIVIGMSDGLTVPFALAAGLTGAAQGNAVIVTAGLAEIIAGSIAMGLGGYLAGKTEIDHYDSELKREYYEVDHYPEKEKEEVREVFEDYGLSPESQIKIVEELAKDKDKWVKFMMRFELGLEKPDINRAKTRTKGPKPNHSRLERITPLIGSCSSIPTIPKIAIRRALGP
jgi:VIT1/CCC1 family predicted Fe2+/Mn2+ transporter